MDKIILLVDKLNIIQKATNRIETDINNMNLRIENINTENAQNNDILKFDGSKWIPDALPPSVDADADAAVSRAQTSASQAHVSKNSAQRDRLLCLIANTRAQDSASQALASKNSAIGWENSTNVYASSALTLINSKANSNDPTFTGAVDLPSGTTINSEPILLSNKIISRVYREGADAQPDYATAGTNNYDYVSVRFHTVDINTFNVPTLGNSASVASGSATLWHNETDDRGQLRTCFTVPSGRSGVYRILANITGKFGDASYHGGNGRELTVFIYRKRGSEHRCISFNIFTTSNSGSNFAASVQEMTTVVDQMFELNGDDQIYIKVRAINNLGDSEQHSFKLIAFRTGDGNNGGRTNLTIMEM